MIDWGSSLSGAKCHIINDKHALCDPQLFMWDTNRQPGDDYKCKRCLKLYEASL
jgi:hypothetical protein